MGRIDRRLVLCTIAALPLTYAALHIPAAHHAVAPLFGAQGPGPVVPARDPGSGPSYPSTRAGHDLPDGVRLLPGEDGTTPVQVRWSLAAKDLGDASALGYRNGVVYVVGGTIEAHDARTGKGRWSTGPDDQDNGLFDDGGVRVGVTADDGVVAFAPYNYEVVVDRRSGKLRTSRTAVGETPPLRPEITRWLGAGALPFTFDGDLATTTITARYPSGRVAWRLRADVSEYEPVGPVAVPGGLVVGTSDGSVIALSYP